MNLKSVWVALIVVAIIAIGGYFFPQVQQLLGRVGTAFPNGICTGIACTVDTAGKTQIGANGTEMTDYEFGSCVASFSSADMIASSTAVGICIDSSFTTSDSIEVTAKYTLSIAPAYQGFPVVGYIATTSGQFGVLVTNATGGATTTVNSGYRTYTYETVR